MGKTFLISENEQKVSHTFLKPLNYLQFTQTPSQWKLFVLK